MTIQEAIKSGKPFRRKDDDCWLFFSPSGTLCLDRDGKISEYGVTEIEDIVADDWIVKP